MSSVSTFLLLNIFSAILPENDSKDNDYFAVLGLGRNASLDEIRKAYRKMSLQLHPDKIAQRGDTMKADQAAQDYERVQEAYSVLQDDKKRKDYKACGHSPARYKFIHQEGMMHPMAIIENLSKSSLQDKSKLVAIIAILTVICLLQPILICAKVNSIIEQSGSLQDSDWVIIFIPLWATLALAIIFWILLLLVVPVDARAAVALRAMESAAWLTGFILLSLQWDRTTTLNWHVVSIPFYVLIVLKIAQATISIQTAAHELNKMVSPEYLAAHEGPLEDISEEKQQEIAEHYTVVTVDGMIVTIAIAHAQTEGIELTEQDIEDLRVGSSPEFQMINEAVNRTRQSLANWLLYVIPFVALVACKVEGQIDSSWWIVFIPVLAFYGSALLSSCYICFCGRHPDEYDDVPPRQSATEGEETPAPQAPDDAQDAKIGLDQDKIGADQYQDQSSSDLFVPVEQQIERTNATSSTTAGETEQASSVPTPTSDTTEYVAEENTGASESEDFFSAEDFYRWQSTQAHARKEALETQSKAAGDFWSSILPMIVVCLIIAKLEDIYDGNNGFNAFWILFPILFIAGLLLCMCGILIYGTGQFNMDEMASRNEPDVEAGDVSSTPNDVDAAACVPPPPSTTTGTLPTPSEEVAHETTEQTPQKHESDMDGLD